MNIHEGDRVLVNLAPFIGSGRRCNECIPCRVLAVDATHVEVRTEYPLRGFSLSVPATWIEGKLEPDEGEARSRVRFATAAEVRMRRLEQAPGRAGLPGSQATLCETIH